MAISYVGSASGQTSCTLPGGVQEGDLLIVLAFRDGSSSTPTLASGWSLIDSNITNSAGSITCYKIAVSGEANPSGFSNASSMILHVYRGTESPTPIGAHAKATGTAATITYPALSLEHTDNTSWVVGLAAHRNTNTDIQSPPTGMTNRIDRIGTSDEVVGHDTNGTVSSWSSKTADIGGSASGWFVNTFEIRAADVSGDVTSPSDPTGVGNSNITENSATISWTASTDNVGVIGYDIDINGTYNKTVSGTSTTFSGLTSSTFYTVGVKAKDAAGNLSNRVTTTFTTDSGSSYPGDPEWTGEYPDGTDYEVPLAGTTVINVSNNTQLAAAITGADPGDRIVLADGNYSGNYTVTVTGTLSSPVSIEAASPGAAVFTTGQIYINNSAYVTVRGISFPTDSEAFKINNSHHVRVTRCIVGPASWVSNSALYNYIYIYGDSHHVTVDYNTLRSKGSGNNIIRIYGNFTTNQVCQYILIHHNKFDTIKLYTENDKEPIRYGVSAMSRSNAYGVIERNYFANCASEPEIVSMKAAYINCIGNTVYRSAGSICYRHGRNGRITDNYSIDDNNTTASDGTKCGGIRFYDSNHYIGYNYASGLGGDNYESSLIIDTGDAETDGSDLLNAHWRVKNSTVTRNVIVNSAHPIKVGDNYSLNPTGMTVTNNITANTTTAGPLYYVGTTTLDSSTISGNNAYASTSAAGMTLGSDGVYRINGYGPRLSLITSDMAGYLATSENDSGEEPTVTGFFLFV
jgi:hypothetical protein